MITLLYYSINYHNHVSTMKYFIKKNTKNVMKKFGYLSMGDKTRLLINVSQKSLSETQTDECAGK